MSARQAVSDVARARAVRLEALLGDLGAVVVAFSGGVDSAYLAVTASRVLGPRALAVTGDSPSYPDSHRRLARRVAADFALAHEIVPTAELLRDGYRQNAGDRCYYCKTELYSTLAALAAARGFAAVLDGTNADDRGDYRPGRRAAAEHGVRSPLDELGFTKADIRTLARAGGIPVWDEPASACLSSRIPHHSPVTAEKLRQIERAEDAVRALGFRVFRVRHHDRLARLEVGADELSRTADPAVASALAAAIREAGYEGLEIDPRGYRQGSLNAPLFLRPVP
ncbi:MAG: ATP-dependent sacrificial sulfur transferase LarE [Vicinamibacterales bacterium]